MLMKSDALLLEFVVMLASIILLQIAIFGEINGTFGLLTFRLSTRSRANGCLKIADVSNRADLNTFSQSLISP